MGTAVKHMQTWLARELPSRMYPSHQGFAYWGIALDLLLLRWWCLWLLQRGHCSPSLLGLVAKVLQ